MIDLTTVHEIFKLLSEIVILGSSLLYMIKGGKKKIDKEIKKEDEFENNVPRGTIKNDSIKKTI